MKLYAEPGHTIAEMLENLDTSRLGVRLNGETVPKEVWKYVRPKAGAVVEVVAFPQGGESSQDKEIITFLAVVAIIILTQGAGAGWFGSAGGALAAGSTGATILAISISVVGMLLLKALIKPPKQDTPGDLSRGRKLNALYGQSNELNPYGAVPIVLGEMRVFPPLAVKPYTRALGNLQSMHLLYDCGYGNILVDNLKLGENDIANFTTVTYWIGKNFGPGQGMAPGSVDEQFVSRKLTTNTSEIATTAAGTERISLDLTYSMGFFGLNRNGDTLPGTATFRIRYRLLGGSWSTLSNTTPDAFVTAPGAFTSTGVTVSPGGSKDPVIVGVEWGVPLGQYEVEVTQLSSQFNAFESIQKYNQTEAGIGLATTYPTSVACSSFYAGGGEPTGVRYVRIVPKVAGSKTNPNDRVIYECVLDLDYYFDGNTKKVVLLRNPWNTDGGNPYYYINGADKVLEIAWQVQNYAVSYPSQEVAWTSLRSISSVTPTTLDTTKIAVYAKASYELNGQLQQLSCRVRQQIPVWQGGGWVTVVTSNPAWIYYWLLTACPANSRQVDPSRVDLTTIQAWAAECDAKGFTYNNVILSQVAFGDLLREVAAAGRATITVKDGLYSVVRDVQQSTPVQFFTPRNSWGFQGARAFNDIVHALRVRFLNPGANYQLDELVVYDDGYNAGNATKYESLQLPGVTSVDAAWRLGRYYLAVARLRQNEYTFNCDVEHLVCQRGDLIKMQHDVTRWGTGWGRIRSIKTNRIRYSEQFDQADWTKTAATVTANAGGGPIANAAVGATYTAEKLCEDASTGGHYIQQPDQYVPAIADNETAVASVYAKAGERSWLLLEVIKRDNLTYGYAYFDLATGAIGASNVGAGNAVITPTAVGGWYRCSISSSVGVGGTAAKIRIVLGSANGISSYAGTAGNGLYIWGAQFEKDTLTEYVPTTTTFNHGGVTLDEGITIKADKSYNARIRRKDGTNVVTAVTPRPASTFANFNQNDWNLRTGAWVNFSQVYTGRGLGPALKCQSQQCWLDSKTLIPFDPTKTYKVRSRFRLMQDPTVGGSGIYAGLCAYLADGVTKNNILGQDNWSAQHYGPSNATQTTAQGWVEYTYYWRGFSAVGVNGTGGTTNPAAPGTLRAGTAYVAPLFLVNYSSGNGITEVEYVEISVDGDVITRWDFTTPQTTIDPGDLVMVGEPGSETQNLIVTKITPGAELSAKITAVEEAPGVYTADSGGLASQYPGGWVSQITGMPYYESPTAPLVEATAAIPSVRAGGIIKSSLTVTVLKPGE